MSGFLSHVQNNIAHLWGTGKRLRKKGCSLSLKSLSGHHLIVDFDKPLGRNRGSNKSRCDYLFLMDSAGAQRWALALALKSGDVDASKSVKQLRAGARAADTFIPSGVNVQFRPVLAFGNLHKAQRQEMKKQRNLIRFRGSSHATRFIRCGAPLKLAL